MKYLLLALLVFLTLYSCRRAPSSPALPIADSVLHEYLVRLNTSPYYDTLSDEYRFLQALEKQDTAYFLKLRTRWRDGENFLKEHEKDIDCGSLPLPHETGADTAFQFFYSTAYNRIGITINVLRKGDSCSLHFVKYKPMDTILLEVHKKIGLADWRRISLIVEESDFWHMKMDEGNDMSGVLNDGGGFGLYGYASGYTSEYHYAPRYHFVKRSQGEELYLFGAFRILLRLAGQEKYL